MELLQQMLQAGQLCDFINDLAGIIQDERIYEMRWDSWLHKIHNMEFDQYVKECEKQMTKQPEKADMNSVETTVKNSMKILESFKLN